jgi:integrase/recombinase XerD
MRAFLVRLPSSVRYWTVVDDGYRVVRVADEYLQHLRLGRDAAESTTKSYAEALALYLRWCEQGSRDWGTAAERLGGFITWLRHTPGGPAVPLSGPGVADVRGAGRINRVLSAVRGFLRHGAWSARCLRPCSRCCMTSPMTGTCRSRSVARRSAFTMLPGRVIACRSPRLGSTGPATPRCCLLRACRSARDRFIMMAMARAGLRSGEVTGLRREDMHLVPDATVLGCPVPGAHLHVRRRDNPNGAWAKSRRSRPVPVDELLVLAYDTYWFERDGCLPARGCDFVLVNLFREPLGAPMRPGALNELLSALSRRAGLARDVHPHMLRHGFGSNVMDVGGALDEAQALLGHASPASTQVYLHPEYDRLRVAVDRVAARSLAGDSW